MVPVYETAAAAVDAEALRARLMAGEISWVTFTSSSTVTNFVKSLGDLSVLKHTRAACIGPVTAATCQKYGIQPDIVAQEYTIDGLAAAICQADKEN